jgi:FAD/FMN-containing dehydrogenase
VGLATDSLTSLELVDASGRRITASDSQNAELFWACRGGGGGFGITTAVTFEAHPIGEVAVFHFEWPFDQAISTIQSAWATVGPSPASVVRRTSRGSWAGKGRARCIVRRLSHMTKSWTCHVWA